jgi:gamma-glutamylcyclotransferase (GGCT)/AIG2-like uncharacterized protein YtfP
VTQVAVYGSLRKTMGNHRVLGDAKFIGTTMTAEPYAMYSLGGFPKVALNQAVSPIVVEIYECNDSQIVDLDRLEGYRGEGYNNFYDRSEVQLKEFGTALIYHIDGDTDTEQAIPDGDWVNYISNRAKRY